MSQQEVEFWNVEVNQKFTIDGKEYIKININEAQEVKPAHGRIRPMTIPENTSVIVDTPEVETIKSVENLPVKPVPLGLSRREYFAAIAFQGLMSIPSRNPVDSRQIARQAVVCADNLIEALDESEF